MSAGGPLLAVKSRRNRRLIFVVVLLIIWVVSGIAAWVWLRSPPSSGSGENSLREISPVTFNKDIAPIIFRNCTPCHRPGQSAPFSLVTYEDVRKRATDIVEVTARRYMPPWLPEHGYGEFADERRLSIDEIKTIQRWSSAGQIEGAAADRPPLPQWNSDWQLGQPDLTLTMPEVYTLAAEGRDVFRNFVQPVRLGEKRFVRGVEFHPGNPKVVHHAFIKVDRTSQSRRMDLRDSEPGFPGMSAPAEIPGGHFLG